MFLCPFDYIRVGDIIKDPRYVPYMQVTRITPCCARVQEGFTLKDIQIESLNKRKVVATQGSDFDIDKQRNNMETRNISITLEQAYVILLLKVGKTGVRVPYAPQNNLGIN